MRAIKIDPDNYTVTEICLNQGSSIAEIKKIIGSESIDFLPIDNEIVMAVNETGKLNGGQKAFTFLGWEMVISGVAVIIGYKKGRLKDLEENLSNFEKIAEWVNVKSAI